MEITGQTEKKISSAVSIASSVLTAIGSFSAIQGLPVLGAVAAGASYFSGAIPLVYSAIKQAGFIRIDRMATLDEGFKRVLEETIEEVKKQEYRDSFKQMLSDIDDILAVKVEKGQITKEITINKLFEAINESIDAYCSYEKDDVVQNERQALIEQYANQFLISLAFQGEIGTYYNSLNIVWLMGRVSDHDEAIRRLEQMIIQTEYEIQLNPCGNPIIDFVGRGDVVTQVDVLLEPGRALLIYGMGGIGKSEFCRYYGDQKRKQGKMVGWFDYRGSLKETFFTIGDPNKSAPKERMEAEYQRVKNYLDGLDAETILIIDNIVSLTNEEVLLLNSLNCQVIITARDNHKPLWGDIKHLELKLLEVEDCVLVFRNYFKQSNESDKIIHDDDTETLRSIVTRAGRHTLAIQLLAKIYAQSPKYKNVSALLAELEVSGFKLPELVTQNRDDEYRDFMEHLKILFDLSGVLADAEKMYVLKNMAIIGSTPTPREQLFKWIGEEYQKAYNELVDSSWIKEQNFMTSMHDMISKAVKEQAAPNYDDCQRMIEVMTQELSFGAADVEQYNPPYFQQNKALGDYILGIRFRSIEVSGYNNKLSDIYKAKGEYDMALIHLKQALEIVEVMLGKQHPITSSIYNNLGIVYNAKCEYNEALKYYMLALEIREAWFGKQHPSTAILYNNMAAVYQADGDYEEALKYNEKAMEIREVEKGRTRPDIATTYHSMGAVYKSRGEYDEALKYYKQALVIREAILGKQHPSTATTYNNIAGVYHAKGEYNEALDYYKQALVIREAVLGKQHPETAASYSNIGSVFHAKGEYDEAIKFIKHALAINEVLLGKRHPATATMYNNLAGVYHTKGEYNEALNYYKKSLEISETVQRKQHPDIATTYSNIAGVYLDKGDWDIALEYFKQALVIQEITLGKQHPDTATTYNNIAGAYYDLCEYDKALVFFKQAFFAFLMRLGANHPYTQEVFNNMTTCYVESDRDQDEFMNWLEQEDE